MDSTARATIENLLVLWPLWGLLALIVACRLASWIADQRRLAAAGIREIDAMDGRTFERRLARLFHDLGYSVERVGRRGDYGADLVVSRNGVRTIVQAKRWSKNVGVKAVQEANAAPAMHGCARGMVVTNRYFTAAAKRLARANDVELWDREKLVAVLLAARKRSHRALEAA
jgi:restriction system protein